MRPGSLRKGFTLIEILISLSVLVIGLVGILVLLPVGLKSSQSAVQDSTTSILAQSIKNSIYHAIKMSGGAAAVNYYHDGVKKGINFPLPASGATVEVPKNAAGAGGAVVFLVGQGGDNKAPYNSKVDYPNQLGFVDTASQTIPWVDPMKDPYAQYAFKFVMKRATKSGGVEIPGLYEVTIYLYRGWLASKVVAGVDKNVPINVFSTLVAAS